jgi:hypothetical protein
MNEKFFKLFHEKHAFQRQLARRSFDFFQWFGFHVVGNHFYELIPDTRFMARNYSTAARELVGIDWRFEECERKAVHLIKTYGAEYQAGRGRFGYTESNKYFQGYDALMLFVFLRDLKPAKMIEVGQGSSTRIALSALELNATETGTSCELISIDPYARLGEHQTPKGVKLSLLAQELQMVDMNPLLENCNFIFVDSSHVYKFGSDVEVEFTRVYPLLRPGTFVHLHDIYSPYEYPLSWALQEKRFWNEQYFLENFLKFNNAFEVSLAVNLLMQQSKTFLEAVRSLSLEPDFTFLGRSFYFQRK